MKIDIGLDALMIVSVAWVISVITISALVYNVAEVMAR